MTKLASALLLLALIAAPTAAAAQNPNPLTANAKVQFGALSGFVVRSAEKVPEGLYFFRPTSEVRTMAQLFGHIADAMFGMCATAAGTQAAAHRHREGGPPSRTAGRVEGRRGLLQQRLRRHDRSERR